jgi:hypothetical protein
MVVQRFSARPPHSWDISGAYAAVLVVRPLRHVSLSAFSLKTWLHQASGGGRLDHGRLTVEASRA